jgi:hypothetical protein
MDGSEVPADDDQAHDRSVVRRPAWLMPAVVGAAVAAIFSLGTSIVVSMVEDRQATEREQIALLRTDRVEAYASFVAAMQSYEDALRAGYEQPIPPIGAATAGGSSATRPITPWKDPDPSQSARIDQAEQALADAKGQIDILAPTEMIAAADRR